MFQKTLNIQVGIARSLWVVLPALIFAVGCGELPNSDSGSIFEVMAINGYYKDSDTFTNQVDMQQNNCSTDGSEIDYEFYSDHFVAVDFLNRHLPNRNAEQGTVQTDAEEYTATVIYLKRYEIRYTPLTTVTAPYPLPSPLVVDVTQSVAVPPCPPGNPGETCDPTIMTQGYFVPVATKDILRQFFIEAGQQLAYDAHYTFYGVNEYGYSVSATGHYNFYVANYNYCDN